jgi:GNAT superfamily N-acetyltransferase
MDEAVIMRPFAPSDEAYIMSTWLRDLRDADPSPLPDDLFFPAQRALITRLLASPAVSVTVAAAADRPDEILGYSVAMPGELLIWLQVRKPLRRKGLARLLLQAAQCPPGTPAAYSTVHAKMYLRNPPRGRSARVAPPFSAPK